MAKNNRFGSDTTTAEHDFENTGGRRAAAREKVSDLGSSASQRIDSSPLMALGAGAALGAVLGAVLPRSQKEKELLRPVGTKLNEAGTNAVDRARDMGKQKFDEMAGDSVRQFFGMSPKSEGGSSTAGSSSSSSSAAGGSTI